MLWLNGPESSSGCMVMMSKRMGGKANGLTKALNSKK
jgi:hypothetical protein